MELSSYEEIDDNNLSKDELNELNLLNTRLRSIKYVYLYEPSETFSKHPALGDDYISINLSK